MSNTVQFDDSVSCERCGRFGAFLFEGAKLCAECYELRGSCCQEFGADDLSAREKVSAEKADGETAPSAKPSAR